MRTRTLTALSIVAALALPVGVHAAKPPKPPKSGTSQVTLATASAVITFGGSTALSGTLSTSSGAVGSQSVVVEANPAPYSGYKAVATVVTDPSGKFTATVKPTVNTRYRAKTKTAPPATSAEVTIGVRIQVGIRLSDSTPRRGATVVFSGRTYPAHDGQPVSIQRRTSTGSYTTIARTKLLDDGTSRSRYRRGVRISRSGVYRVRVVSGDTDHQVGFSRTRTLTVR